MYYRRILKYLNMKSRRGKYHLPELKTNVTFLNSSPSTDLPKKNHVMNRKYYGSTEMLCNPKEDEDINDKHFRSLLRFRVENGETDKYGHQNFDGVKGSMVHLENPEWQTRWYFKYFLGRLHQNYVGVDANKNPFILSVCTTDEDNFGVLQYRAILWKRMGSERRCIPHNSGKLLTPKAILQLAYDMNIEKGLKEVLDPEIQKELLVLEDQEGSVNFKFGVLFAKQGQTTDDEMLSNEKESVSFAYFLKLLGERVLLKGWTKFRGGLDVKCNMTGIASVYTQYEGHEIMFHVSTLLPFSDDPQQVERKRHIGNDIVNIVFQECESHEKSTFTPYGIRSQFTHIYALVTYSTSENSFRITVFSEINVPLFGPPLPSSPVFTNHEEFRDFLLVKMINGEKATHLTPMFSKRRHRTLEMLLTNLVNSHLPIEKAKSRRFANTLSDSTKAKQQKENERHKNFILLGQKLKDNLIPAEDPTRLVNIRQGGNRSNEPWGMQCVCNYFPTKVTCGDSWSNGLILGTEEGVFKLEDGSMKRLFDKSMDIKQLFVDEDHDVLILRADKGRDGKIYIFSLSYFDESNNQAMTKVNFKHHKLEKAKGAHLLAVSERFCTRLFSVAANKKIQLYQWRDMENKLPRVVNSYDLVKEVVVIETPCLLTLVDCGENGFNVCIGYRDQFDLIDMASGSISKLYEIESASTKIKSNLLSAIDTYEDDIPSLLLSYNHMSCLKLLNGENASNFSLQWNSTPKNIVYIFPYVLAFTRNTIEIRLVVNGTLVHTLVLPKVSLISAKDDIYFSSSRLTQLENQKEVVSQRRRRVDVSQQNFQQMRLSTTTEQQRCIYKMSLSSLQQLSVDGSSAERIPNIRTPLTPYGEITFEFSYQNSPNNDNDFSYMKRNKMTKTSVSTTNLNAPFTWDTIDEDKLDDEFRELIESNQGESSHL
ncbi:GTPase-activating Rap/Ran-GAP domain-like protein 3 isoform X2 [Xenia sp. Carnegie-2017]|uniref:GTPase-activating Rap/Ran-GAP domain-like protein 3 isoform X2 n=1 Tax=Xenia sp. Carnegie-2017 TaxID=2897299 RepID=UPI001F03F7AA|nr:GTPase-activating Rap/Ran-GAP domain-like protein 3 isoform X2 [Xenia sp. Carnegie-2017]